MVKTIRTLCNGLGLRLKLWGGFLALVCISAILGYLGRSSLTYVGARTDAAGRATDLIQISAAGRLAEKQFMLDKSPDQLDVASGLADSAAEKAKALNTLLDSPEDQQAVNTVVAQFDSWQSALSQYASRETEKSQAETAMRAAANVALQQCADLREAQKQELSTEQAADSERRQEMLWKADAANRLIKLASSARLAEQGFVNSKDRQLVDTNQSAVDDILALCTDLKNRFDSDGDKAIVDQAVVSGREYQAAFQAWVSVQDRIEEAQQVTAEAAEKGQASCEALRKSQDSTLRDLFE